MTPQTSAPWWQTGVVYQVYPWSYQDSNGDGIGDLPGVIQRLDHLVRLGVDAVWLSPFYPSPMADFGYDVSDYCDVDPRFGTLADADRLIAAAHDRGLRLIVDLVPNHSSIEHPWFVESRSSRDNPKRHWYVWRDGKAPGEPPNNWLATFGGPAWDWDDHTGQWYLHSFLPDQPDLNWRNPELRQAMLDVVRFWLDRGVDGFRVDVAAAIMKDPALRDNPPNPSSEGRLHKPIGEYDSQLHIHDTGHPDVHGVYREMRQILDGYESSDGRARVIIGEIHVFDLDRWARYFGQGDEMHLPFNFGLLKVPWRADAVAGHIREIERVTAEVGWPSYVLGNHDEHRVVARLGAGQARVGMLLLLTLRGTPTLYYGDELAHPDVVIPPERERDPWGLRVPGLGLSRDPARTPMPWSNQPGGGFTEPSVEPWLPLVEDLAAVNAASQAADPVSMLSFTTMLLALRRGSAALSRGIYRELAVSEAVLIFERRSDDDVLLIAANLSHGAQTVGLGEGAGEVLVGTHPERQGHRVDLAQLTLGPDEAVIVRPRCSFAVASGVQAALL